MLGNGDTVKDADEENKSGMMDHNMKDIGAMIWQTAEED